ncbi:MAG: DUF2203 domain-containing protein [Planctomycetes bacterium]|nr:DUF2203 domain-containing protein [Planctomycetota bacterium]
MARKARHFTIEQANRALPLVRRIVEDVVRGYAELTRRQEALQQAVSGGDAPAREQRRGEVEAQVEEINVYIEELNHVGCELKDFRMGLVDFPATLDGRIVCLCWKLGEDDVSWWHEVSTGFGGRQTAVGVFR